MMSHDHERMMSHGAAYLHKDITAVFFVFDSTNFQPLAFLVAAVCTLVNLKTEIAPSWTTK